MAEEVARTGRVSIPIGWRICSVLALVGLAGCAGETRYLTCLPRPPAVERRAYELHDPFSDDRLGPATYNRPRGFETPRSETRASYDLRTMRAALQTGQPVVEGTRPVLASRWPWATESPARMPFDPSLGIQPIPIVPAH